MVINDASKCNGGSFFGKSNTQTTGTISKRIAMRVNVSGSAIAAGPSNLDSFSWNEDIVLASFY